MSVLRQEQLDAFRTLFIRCEESEYQKSFSADRWQQLVQGASFPEHPLPFASYRSFFNHALMPGMPGACLPVESLYKEWGVGDFEGAGSKGLYLGAPARHIMALCAQIGIQIPDDFSATPDHILLLLELHEFLREHASEQDRADFAANHFDWLGDYRAALQDFGAAQADEVLAQASAFYCELTRLIEAYVGFGATPVPPAVPG